MQSVLLSGVQGVQRAVKENASARFSVIVSGGNELCVDRNEYAYFTRVPDSVSNGLTAAQAIRKCLTLELSGVSIWLEAGV